LKEPVQNQATLDGALGMEDEDDFGILRVVQHLLDNAVAHSDIRRGKAEVSLDQTLDNVEDDSSPKRVGYPPKSMQRNTHVLLCMPRIGLLKVRANRSRLLCIQCDLLLVSLVRGIFRGRELVVFRHPPRSNSVDKNPLLVGMLRERWSVFGVGVVLDPFSVDQHANPVVDEEEHGHCQDGKPYRQQNQPGNSNNESQLEHA